MASILKVDELRGIAAAGDITITSEGGSAKQSLQQGLAKAWVNFNGTGTIAARDSFNLSSLADNGTGDYTVNWSTALNNVNYNATAAFGVLNSTSEIASKLCVNGPYTTTSLRMTGGYHIPGSQVQSDRSLVQINVHGDLA